ncbi:hypothetical protein [Actinosynnema sp.]
MRARISSSSRRIDSACSVRPSAMEAIAPAAFFITSCALAAFGS